LQKNLGKTSLNTAPILTFIQRLSAGFYAEIKAIKKPKSSNFKLRTESTFDLQSVRTWYMKRYKQCSIKCSKENKVKYIINVKV